MVLLEFSFAWKMDSSLFFETTKIYINSQVYNCVYRNCGFSWYIRFVETDSKKKKGVQRCFSLYYKHGSRLKVRAKVTMFLEDITGDSELNSSSSDLEAISWFQYPSTTKEFEKSRGVPILLVPCKVSQENLSRFVDADDKININCKLEFDESEFDVRLSEPIILPIPVVGEKLFLSAIDESIQGYFSDIILMSKDNKSFHCHKCYLSAKCEYFLSLFKNFIVTEPDEGLDVIKFKDLDCKILTEVLRFIYTNQISDEISVFALDLVHAADKFKLAELKIHCEIAMFNSVNRMNAVEYLIIAHRYDLFTVKDKSVSVIVDYFFDIRQDENWRNLKVEQPHLVDLVLKDSSARANVSMKILT